MAKIDEARDARLAAALRDNLKRRKAQARDAAEPGNGAVPEDDTGAAPAAKPAARAPSAPPRLRP